MEPKPYRKWQCWGECQNHWIAPVRFAQPGEITNFGHEKTEHCPKCGKAASMGSAWINADGSDYQFDFSLPIALPQHRNNVHLRFDKVTPKHATITLFMRGANCGPLIMASAEAIWLNHILSKGCEVLGFGFISSGIGADPDPAEVDKVARDLDNGKPVTKKDKTSRPIFNTTAGQIANILSGKEWTPDTCQQIADLLRAAGYEIKDID